MLNSSMSLQLKEKVAGIPSSHLREDFPPHPDDPPRRKITCIVPYIGGNSANGQLAAWGTTSAVLEPTSDLLMFVGLAGLALRRRRA